ncbi:hypothetical protein E4U21_007324 [Claviceps maximensis]|nr:hypothetical protein E4U21_007324 [Claviceps maximensis]
MSTHDSEVEHSVPDTQVDTEVQVEFAERTAAFHEVKYNNMNDGAIAEPISPCMQVSLVFTVRQDKPGYDLSQEFWVSLAVMMGRTGLHCGAMLLREMLGQRS